jgi:hypothetical protein
MSASGITTSPYLQQKAFSYPHLYPRVRSDSPPIIPPTGPTVLAKPIASAVRTVQVLPFQMDDAMDDVLESRPLENRGTTRAKSTIANLNMTNPGSGKVFETLSPKPLIVNRVNEALVQKAVQKAVVNKALVDSFDRPRPRKRGPFNEEAARKYQARRDKGAKSNAEDEWVRLRPKQFMNFLLEDTTELRTEEKSRYTTEAIATEKSITTDGIRSVGLQASDARRYNFELVRLLAERGFRKTKLTVSAASSNKKKEKPQEKGQEVAWHRAAHNFDGLTAEVNLGHNELNQWFENVIETKIPLQIMQELQRLDSILADSPSAALQRLDSHLGTDELDTDRPLTCRELDTCRPKVQRNPVPPSVKNLVEVPRPWDWQALDPLRCGVDMRDQAMLLLWLRQQWGVIYEGGVDERGRGWRRWAEEASMRNGEEDQNPKKLTPRELKNLNHSKFLGIVNEKCIRHQKQQKMYERKTARLKWIAHLEEVGRHLDEVKDVRPRSTIVKRTGKVCVTRTVETHPAEEQKQEEVDGVSEDRNSGSSIPEAVPVGSRKSVSELPTPTVRIQVDSVERHSVEREEVLPSSSVQAPSAPASGLGPPAAQREKQCESRECIQCSKFEVQRTR